MARKDRRAHLQREYIPHFSSEKAWAANLSEHRKAQKAKRKLPTPIMVTLALHADWELGRRGHGKRVYRNRSRDVGYKATVSAGTLAKLHGAGVIKLSDTTIPLGFEYVTGSLGTILGLVFVHGAAHA